MQRREFIIALGGAAAWPRAARAQQRAISVVGYLDGGLAGGRLPFVAAVRDGLKKTGYVEGENIAFEHRFAEGQLGRLPEMARDLARSTSVIVAAGNSAARAATAATTTIPIVFSLGGDPVKLGLVPSLNRPDGNVTGVTFFANQLEAKRLDILHELVPSATVIAALVNPGNPAARDQTDQLVQGARSLGVQVHVATASNDSELESTFGSHAQLAAAALLVSADPFFYSRREQIVALAAKYAIPAMYFTPEAITGGGLVSYGPSLTDGFRQAGVYAGRILKGEKPADLPVTRSTKFDLVVNLKTAKSLGITVPPTMLARADEVIE